MIILSYDDGRKTQLRRSERIQNHCNRHEGLRNDSISKFTLINSIVDDRHGLLFCLIPKVGCTNWKRVFMFLLGKQHGRQHHNVSKVEDIPFESVHFGNSRLPRLAHMSPKKQESVLKHYKKVMFVREPCARLVSAYRDKFENASRYRSAGANWRNLGDHIIDHYRGDSSPDDIDTSSGDDSVITFAEFAAYVVDAKRQNDVNEAHWVEMHKMCSPCQIQYDYIGTLETVAADAKFILTSIGLGDIVSYPNARSTGHFTGSAKRVGNYITSLPFYLIKQLQKVYALDFELFGYPDLYS